MSDFRYDIQGPRTYLIYEFDKDAEIDTLGLGMITNNNIPGIVEASFMQVNESKQIKFDVTSRVLMSQFLEGTVNRKQLIGVFKGITDAYLSAEKYMLMPDNFIIDPNLIFINVSTCDTKLIYIPVIEKPDTKNNLQDYFKNILLTSQYNQSENNDYVVRLLNYLNSTEKFRMVEFNSLLATLENKNNSAQREFHSHELNQQSNPGFSQRESRQPQKMPVPPQQMPVPPQGRTPMPPPIPMQNNMTPEQQMPVMVNSSFGETTVLGMPGAGETTVLSESNLRSQEVIPYLIRKRNNERILVKGELFKLGKESSYTNYTISDNTAISRSHANIVKEEDEYYIIDQNSTNHTFVDEEMIAPNTMTKLTHDCHIRLADEDFIFKLF